MHPANSTLPERGLVQVPYQRTLVEMFEDLHEEIKELKSNEKQELESTAKPEIDIVKVFEDVTKIISDDCKECMKKYKKCDCRDFKRK